MTKSTTEAMFNEEQRGGHDQAAMLALSSAPQEPVVDDDAAHRKELRSVLADCSEFLAGDAFEASGYPEAKELADRCEAMLSQVVWEDHDRLQAKAPGR